MPVRFQLDELSVDTSHVTPPFAPGATLSWRVSTFDEGEPSFLTLAADPGGETPIAFEGSLVLTPAIRTTYRIVGNWNEGRVELGQVTISVGETVAAGADAFLQGGVIAMGDRFVNTIFFPTGLLRRRGDAVTISPGRVRVEYRLLASVGLSYEPNTRALGEYAFRLEGDSLRAERARPIELELPTLRVDDEANWVLDGRVVREEVARRMEAILATRDALRGRLAELDGVMGFAAKNLMDQHVSPEYFVNGIDVRKDALLLARCLRGRWVLQPGAARDVGVGPDGSVWVVGTDDGAYHLVGDGWQRSDLERAARVAVGPTGPWIVDRDGRALRLEPQGWVELGANGTASDIGVGANGDAWIIRPDQRIARWNGAGWDDIDGAAVRVSVGPDGAAVVANGEGRIFRREGATWVEDDRDGRALDVGVGADGTLWIIGLEGGTYRRLTSRWEQVPGGANNVAVAPTGAPWVTNGATNLFRREYGR